MPAKPAQTRNAGEAGTAAGAGSRMTGAMRDAKLLVAVRGLSGRTYPTGTVVRLSSGGAVVDAFVGGDWLPLSWWEFAECREAGEPLPAE